MSHTATGEWKSFEIRMRRRRAERCAARADMDLARGAYDDARAAVQEARRLAPDLPQLADLEDSIQAAETAARLTQDRRSGDVSLYAGIALMLAAGVVVAIGVARYGPTVDSTPGPTAVSQSSAAPDPAPPAVHPDSTPAVPAQIPTARVIVDREPVTVAESRSPSAAPDEMEADATAGRIAELPQLPAATPPPTRYAGQLRADTLPNVATLPVEKVANPSEPTFARTDAVPIPSPPVRSAAPANPDAGFAAAPLARSPVVANTAEPAVANTSVGAAVTAPHDDVLVQQTLDRYATAYTRLDAQAAQQVWPSVDREALARAFGGLALQRVSLGDCQIDVQGVAARAACAGTETWAPKIGARGPHTAARNWTFELTKAGSDWQIVSARVQNK